MKLSHAAAIAAFGVVNTLAACGSDGLPQGSSTAVEQRVEQEQSVPKPGARPPRMQPQETVSDSTAAPSSEDASTQNPEEALEAVLRPKMPDMAYADFRALALSHGWKPLENPDCMLNMAGEIDGQLYCSKYPDSPSCKLCDDLPELSSSSNDLYSLMQFSHSRAKKILRVTGWGEIERWRETGENRAFVVRQWGFTETPAR